MTEPRDPSPDRATGESGVAGSRRGAEEPSGSSVPDEIGVREPTRGPTGDPTTSSLSEMVSATGQSKRPDEVEETADSGQTDSASPTGTAEPPA
jgi:hypothetical protein